MIWLNTFPIWFQVFLVIVGLWMINYYISKRRYFSLGNKLPGPKPWPLVGNIFHAGFKKKRLDLLGMINKLNNAYGFVGYWLGHDLLVFGCTAEDAKIYFNSPALLDRSHFFKILEPVFGQGLITANGIKWKTDKKLLDPVFKHKSILKGSVINQQKTDILIRLLEKETGSTFSVYSYISKCVCDLSCGTFTGIVLDLQEYDTYLHDEIEKIGFLTARRMEIYWQYFDFIFKWTKAGKRYYESLDKVNSFLTDHIKIYKQVFLEEGHDYVDFNEDNPSIKSFLMRVFGDNKKKEEINDQDIRDFIITTIGAALETTASTISFALMMLGIHQDMQKKLYKEISSAAENGFDDRDLKDLDFLDRIIKETLRLFTPIPITLRKADDDIQFGEHLVPKDASVGINMFAIHHDPKHYEKPNSFNPDHFLPEQVSKRDPYAFLPFSTGKRKCVGENFAYLTMRLIIAKIVYNYHIICDSKLEDIPLRYLVVIKAKNLNYPIQLIKR